MAPPSWRPVVARRHGACQIPVVMKRGRWAGFWALWRFVRSRESGVSPKVILLLALLYVVFPTDLVPDVLPLAGWLDDVGVVAFVLAWLNRAFRRSHSTPSAPAGSGAGNPVSQ